MFKLGQYYNFLKNISGHPGALKAEKHPFVYSGNYQSWSQAKQATKGYDQPSILEKVVEATRKVVQNPNLYERDSVVFTEYEYSWPLLAHILWVAHKNKGELSLLDFGGSLGTTYFQNRLFTKDLKKVRWGVVEQKHFVEIGKNEFQTEQLKFFNTLEEGIDAISPQILLFSSSLQYLPAPIDIIRTTLELNFEFIFLDRTAVLPGNEDRLTIQNVPASIYEASYPAWFFGEDKLINLFAQKYDLIAKFPAFVGDKTYIEGDVLAGDKGFIFQRKGYQ